MTHNNTEWSESQSPLQKLNDEIFTAKGIDVYIKRDDLLQPFSGNKGRKLKYTWKSFLNSGKTGLLTMGGPFSNHVHAFAILCSYFGVSGKVIIRGEADDPMNPVLNDVRRYGVEVIPMSRQEYSGRYDEQFQRDLESRFPDFFFIPEGGSGADGIKGCEEIAKEIMDQLGRAPDIVVTAAGTGTTAFGISSGFSGGVRIAAISAMREKIIRDAFSLSSTMVADEASGAVELNTEYTFGGFAKWDGQLLEFIREFEQKHGIVLDPLYTAKACFAMYDMIESGAIPRGSTVVLLHTGGMPGRMAFNYRFPGLLEVPS